MSNGLAQSVTGFDLTANTDTLVYTGPATTKPSITVYMCNRGSVPAKVRIARGTGGSPAATDYLLYDVSLLPGSPLILSGLRLSASGNVWVRSDTANVTAQVDGAEG